MILPQVHLRKPCYDFYFLQAIDFDRLLGQQKTREYKPLNQHPHPGDGFWLRNASVIGRVRTAVITVPIGPLSYLDTYLDDGGEA